MARDNTTTIVGNVVRDPDLRFTRSGKPVCSFSIAWNNRYQRQGETVEEVSYFDIVAWNSLAENVASTLRQGARVAVTGRLDQRSWEQPDGTKRTKIEIVADEVGPSLRWATAEIKRTETRQSDVGRAAAPTSNGPAPAPAVAAAPTPAAAGPAPDPNDPFGEF